VSGFSHDLAGGNGNLVIETFQSPNFVHNVSGWQVTQAGDAEFNNVQTRGAFFGFEVIINDSGAFFYSSTPAHGNLIASITSASGTDGFGNAYGAGFNLYGSSGAFANLINGAGGNPNLLMLPPSVTSVTASPMVFAFSSNAGLANEVVWLVMSSGKESGLADAAIQLLSESADTTVAARMIFEFGGTTAVTLTPTGFSADAWNNVTVDAGWGSLGEPAQYRLMPDQGFVALRGDISHAGTTAQVAINSGNPLPVAYRPAATRYYRAPQAADGAGAIQVDSSGVITMRASGFTATQAILDGIYSLA
jgi:hypothetical protein